MNMKKKTCCIIGQDLQSLNIKDNSLQCDMLLDKIKEIIIQLIEKDFVYSFVVGMNLGIDMLTAQIIISLKDQYPTLDLECVIPYEAYCENWNESQRNDFFDIISKCDKETLLQRHYSHDCISSRDKYLINNSGYFLVIWDEKTAVHAEVMNGLLSAKGKMIHLDPKTLNSIYYIK